MNFKNLLPLNRGTFREVNKVSVIENVRYSEETSDSKTLTLHLMTN